MSAGDVGSTESSDGSCFGSCHRPQASKAYVPPHSPAPKQQLSVLCPREPGMRLMSWQHQVLVWGIMLLGSQWDLHDPRLSSKRPRPDFQPSSCYLKPEPRLPLILSSPAYCHGLYGNHPSLSLLLCRQLSLCSQKQAKKGHEKSIRSDVATLRWMALGSPMATLSKPNSLLTQSE